MSYVPIVDLDQAIASIVQRAMSESLSKGDTPERAELRTIVLKTLKELWPDEYQQQQARVRFVPSEGAGVRAMYMANSQESGSNRGADAPKM